MCHHTCLHWLFEYTKIFLKQASTTLPWLLCGM